MDNNTEHIDDIETEDIEHAPDPESVKAVRDFVGLFVKTIHTLMLYPASNPLPNQFREQFFHTAQQVLREHPALLLATTDSGFHFEGESVFEAEPSDTNPAYALFRDGVREIGLMSTLNRDEADEFLDLFVRALSRTGEQIDLANELWELGIRSIYYRTVDHVAEGELIAPPAPEDFERPAALFFSTIDFHESAKGRESSDKDQNPHGYQGVQEERYRQICEILKGEIQIGADEARQVLDILSADAECDCLQEAFRIYDEILRGKNTTQTMAEIVEITHYQFDTMVERNQWAVLPRMLENIRSWLADFADQPSMTESLLKTLYHAGGRQVLSRMAAFINENPQADLQLFREYLDRLDSTSLGAVTAMMGDLEHHAARKMVYNLLAERAEEAVDLVGNYVFDKRWYVVRNVALILRHVNRPRAVTFLKRAAKHSDPRVRLEAVRSLGILRCSEADEVLLGFLDDPDPSLQIQAYKALAPTPSTNTFEALEKRMNTTRISRLDPRVRRELLAAYARAGGPRALPFLLMIIHKRKIFRKNLWEQIKLHAVYALGEIESPSAEGILREISHVGDPALGTAARQVLDLRERSGNTEDDPEEEVEQ